MKRLLFGLVLIAAIVSPLGSDRALAQTPVPVARFVSRTAGLPQSGPYDIAHFLYEFEPGAATPWHTHPGLVLVTVMEGEVTFSMGGTDKTYRAGDHFVELPNEAGQASNRSAARSSVLATFILPKDAPLSTPQPGDTTPPPRPIAKYLTRTAGLPQSGPYEVAHFILEFAPGAATPWHTHPGLVLVTVIEGEVTFSTPEGEKAYKVGDNFVEPPDGLGQASNRTAGRTRVLASFVLPPAAPLSTPHPAPAMPLPDTDVEGAPLMFPETGYSLDGEFLGYWRAHGIQAPGLSAAQRSLALFGYPISEAQIERNSSGDLVLTQWFERARFEYHPSNPVSSRVVLGRLGAELAFVPAPGHQAQQTMLPGASWSWIAAQL